MAGTARMDGAALIMLTALSVIWGGSFILNAVILEEVPVMTLVALRVVLAALVLWPLIALSGLPVPRGPVVWAAFMFMGFANNVVPFVLIVWGQTSIGAGLAAILNATTPLFAALLAGLFLADETLSTRKVIGLLLGLAGVAALVGPAALGAIGSAVLPQLAILGATLSYGIAAVFARRFARWGVKPTVVAAGQLTGSSIMMVPLALAVDGVPTALPSTTVVWSILGLAVVATAGAYVLYFSIIGRAGATNASLVTVLVPVFAGIMGVAILGERWGAEQLVGMALIIAGFAVLDGRLSVRRAMAPVAARLSRHR